jgi:hypothetical protein
MLTAWLVALASAAAGDDFDARFTGKTVRFDFEHCGCAAQEQIAPDRFRLEGDWPGSRTQLEDKLDYGKYRFVVRDPASGATLYSRGYCSVYGEWEVTGEAKRGWRAFHESARFPEPKGKVALALEKRAADLSWKEIWRGELDLPADSWTAPPIAARGGVMPIFENGPRDEGRPADPRRRLHRPAARRVHRRRPPPDRRPLRDRTVCVAQGRLQLPRDPGTRRAGGDHRSAPRRLVRHAARPPSTPSTSTATC